MQSAICIVLGGLLLAASGFKSTGWRAASVTAALAAFLALSFALPFPARAFTMGDGSSIVQDRSNFTDIVHYGRQIKFSAHLAYNLLDRIDAALGATATSPLEAYRALSWLMGAFVALCVWVFAATDGWSPRSVRYAGLALLAPATLMYFGYLEVGYLSLSAAAFPFIARDVLKRDDLTGGMLVGALLFGLGAALHGVGYLSIAAIAFAILLFDFPIARRIVLATTLGAAATGAALIWLWYYLAVMGYDVTPGHASNGFMIRPLLQQRIAETRIVYPLLSGVGARDIFFSGLVAGLPIVLVVLWNWKHWRREARLALAFAVPCLLAFALFWPPQGIAIEMDMIVALFPAVYALLWVCSQSLRASIVSAVLLAAGQAAFWYVVYGDQFINPMLR